MPIFANQKQRSPDVTNNLAPAVSGRAFLGLIKHIKERKGSKELARIIAASGEQTKQIFEERIWPTVWYDYQPYADFLNAIDRLMGCGNTIYCRELGFEAGKRDISTVYAVYTVFASAEKLIRSCDKIWAKYYRNAGRMEAMTWEEDDTTGRIFDFPEMDPAHCRLMEGWMGSTLNAIGFKVKSLKEIGCMSKGHPCHEFHCTWTR